jgi:hypothetical protein
MARNHPAFSSTGAAVLLGALITLSKREIAKRSKVGRTSIHRVLTQKTLALSVLYFPIFRVPEYEEVFR